MHDLYSAKVLEESGRVDEDIILGKVGTGQQPKWGRLTENVFR